MAQDGSLYVVGDTCYLKYYIIDAETRSDAGSEQKRVHKTIQLCKKSEDDGLTWWKKKGKWGFSTGVRGLQRQKMDEIRAEAKAAQAAFLKSADSELRVVDFWERIYLPYCETGWKGTGMKPSTVRGFKQIWRQHLKNHFADVTLQGYTSDLAKRFLSSLKTTQGKNSLRHLRALGSAMFNEAIERGLRTGDNPWHIKLPKDCKTPSRTAHYTLEEAENMVTALVDHVDCQLMIALACFLGLRPGEIAALRWEDFDAGNVHIRRSVVRGKIGTPKTEESLASLPLISQVKVPLELWRRKCGKPEEGWVFGSSGVLPDEYIVSPELKYLAGGPAPVDLHNVISRVIIPHVNGRKCVPCDKVQTKSKVVWKGLYAGRRGACTAVIESTGGNYAVAQALLRHKSMTTTLNVYKKQITPDAFKAGMKLLEAAATAGDGR
jgi:integrase